MLEEPTLSLTYLGGAGLKTAVVAKPPQNTIHGHMGHAGRVSFVLYYWRILAPQLSESFPPCVVFSVLAPILLSSWKSSLSPPRSHIENPVAQAPGLLARVMCGPLERKLFLSRSESISYQRTAWLNRPIECFVFLCCDVGLQPYVSSPDVAALRDQCWPRQCSRSRTEVKSTPSAHSVTVRV